MTKRADIIAANREKLIRETLTVFQPFYKQILTETDAIEIIESLVSFSEALLKLENDTKSTLAKVNKTSIISIQKFDKTNLKETEEIK